jgi:hypothetical protein
LEETVEKLDINNVRMNFTFDVTPDAYTEIQIDPRTGETIQGRGRGILTMNIDTQGNFSMSGNYEITEAKYNFSLYNILRKNLSCSPVEGFPGLAIPMKELWISMPITWKVYHSKAFRPTKMQLWKILP